MRARNKRRRQLASWVGGNSVEFVADSQWIVVPAAAAREKLKAPVKADLAPPRCPELSDRGWRAEMPRWTVFAGLKQRAGAVSSGVCMVRA